ncbi:MAG: helicase-associated domain-containing protein [SAR324 cluster bacterium]|nr:helicase-associated domain-containing protein [SAR324 cluster bacterium]
MSFQGPLIIQSDHSFLLEVQHPHYTECRDFLVQFAELVKSPEFIHTYKVSPLSLWNAAALEIPFHQIVSGMEKFSKYAIPSNILVDIQEWYGNYGKLVLKQHVSGKLFLQIQDDSILERLLHDESLKPFRLEPIHEGLLVAAGQRGNIKHTLIKIGYPVKDLCGYLSGESLKINLCTIDADNRPFQIRDYQKDAIDAFYHAGQNTGGNGIIVLPCGSGKTIIGLGVISQISNHTLIITTNNISVRQWNQELVNKTDLSNDKIGEFTGQKKEIQPITITTYQMLTYRKSKEDPMENLELFTKCNWGLIIYDEVHLLPAPVFRATTDIQARRRLGLTATLIREDGKEDDVFALIGPKRYDLPWKILENKGFIATAYCTEYRISLPSKTEHQYAHASKRTRFRIAAENPKKTELVQELLEQHSQDQILVIGQYITQLEELAKKLKIPLITGKTKHEEREQLYQRFKTGDLKILLVSKVANFAVDLPDANILIQISGTFGSRQEEAQRLGRILRPKQKNAFFYTLISKGTDEQQFSSNRQLFLVEQGYRYQIQYF